MGRAPCCDKNGLKKGPWTPEEDQKLIDYIQRHGHGSWRTLPKHAGLLRCGKSCRLRWTNYLRPDIKRGKFSFEEEQTIIQLHGVMGNKWSAIAAHLPGRTDNEIKNYWNTHLKKRLLQMGIDPVTHRPRMDLFNFSGMGGIGMAGMGMGMGPMLSHMAAQWENARLEAIAREYLNMVSAYRSANMLNQTTSVPNNGASASASASACASPSNSNSYSSPRSLVPPSYLDQEISNPYPNNPNQINSGSDYNVFASYFLEPATNSSQTCANNLSKLSPTSTLEGFPTNNTARSSSHSSVQFSHNNDSSPMTTNDPCCSIPDVGFEGSTNNPSPTMINNLEEQIFGLLKTNSAADSLPPLMSSTTTSPDMFADSHLVQSGSTGDFPMSEIFLDFNAEHTNSKESNHGGVTDFSDSSLRTGLEEGSSCRDYWSNMLKFMSEQPINISAALNQ